MRRWPPWLHGVVAGVLVTGYTFYFIPLALATVAGIVIDLARRRPWAPTLLRPLVIGAVGLVVSAWYWLPLVALALAGAASENYQTGWFIQRHAEVVSPLDSSAAGLVMTVGVLYLVAAFRHRLAEGLLLAVVAGYVVLGAGLALTAVGAPVLVFKVDDYIRYGLLAAGVIGVVQLGGVLRRRLGEPEPRSAPARVTAVAVVLMSLAGALYFVDTWASGKPVAFAHATRLPGGALPRYGDEVPERYQSRRGAQDSVVEIARALGLGSADDRVVVTHRVDLLAVSPVHPFITWTRPYSNPFAEFDQRLALLQRMAASDAPELAELAADNGYGEIDAFVLDRRGDRWVLRVKVDDFPYGSRGLSVAFRAAQFDNPHWEVTRLDGTAVVDAVR